MTELRDDDRVFPEAVAGLGLEFYHWICDLTFLFRHISTGFPLTTTRVLVSRDSDDGPVSFQAGCAGSDVVIQRVLRRCFAVLKTQTLLVL